ncbi:hypothetical protein JCGZ_13840 [Jatropha curcas]|uniref:Uncharacterized protein n=1 Tax=Jatropha curcas TaxID=180498 RepID=A0A067KB79_JATCU|nr:hypothetical protein JCGZ_13840 [Jatropha curcas]
MEKGRESKVKKGDEEDEDKDKNGKVTWKSQPDSTRLYAMTRLGFMCDNIKIENLDWLEFFGRNKLATILARKRHTTTHIQVVPLRVLPHQHNLTLGKRRFMMRTHLDEQKRQLADLREHVIRMSSTPAALASIDPHASSDPPAPSVIIPAHDSAVAPTPDMSRHPSDTPVDPPADTISLDTHTLVVQRHRFDFGPF